VWQAATEEGNVWKVAAYNRRNADKKVDAPRQLALTVDATSGVRYRNGGGGGMQIATRQAQNADPGPMQYEEASSSLEREDAEKDREEGQRLRTAREKRKAVVKAKKRELRQHDLHVPNRELA